MKQSDNVGSAAHGFFDRLSVGDVGGFYDTVELADSTLVLGTAPGEVVTEEARLRFGFELEGLTMTPVSEYGCWEEGTLGWWVGEVAVGLPGGARISWRLTMIFHQQGETWKLAHMHASVAVPDNEVVDLQKRWGTTPS